MFSELDEPLPRDRGRDAPATLGTATQLSCIRRGRGQNAPIPIRIKKAGRPTNSQTPDSFIAYASYCNALGQLKRPRTTWIKRIITLEIVVEYDYKVFQANVAVAVKVIFQQ